MPNSGSGSAPSGPDAAEPLAALRKAEASFRDFLDHCPDGIFVRAGTTAIYVNDALLALIGYQREELIGKDLTNIIVHPRHRHEVLSHRLEKPDETDLREHIWLRRDGGSVIVEVVGVSVTFEGAPARIVMCRDVTERRKMQAKLVVADRMASLGTLAAGIAHEINNPLAYVSANLELLSEALQGVLPAESPLYDMLADACEGAGRVRRIVRGLRAFSHPDAERNAHLDLRQVADTAIDLAANEIRHRAELIRDYQEVPLVDSDEGRLVQVVVNLLVNAAQSIPVGNASGNRIRVQVGTHESGRAMVAVHDTGAGIPPPDLERIFDPFFTTKPIGEGSGLGLSISHNIIANLGGEIVVESEVGRGSCFKVLVPPTLNERS